MIVDSDLTPTLSLFAKVGNACVGENNYEGVLQVLSLVKASGYELDTIGSAESGRAVLAAGIVAADKLNNVPLGLRLLTAAEKADVSPSRGDTLTCQISKEVRFDAPALPYPKPITNDPSFPRSLRSRPADIPLCPCASLEGNPKCRGGEQLEAWREDPRVDVCSLSPPQC